MTTSDKVKEFLVSCVEQAKVINGDIDQNNVHHLILIQLCGKIFELEERIKGLGNE